MTDPRFEIAGRLLALSEEISAKAKVDGPEEAGRDPLLLHALAQAVALHGIEYGRGWIQGLWHGQGVRIHSTWIASRDILGEPRIDPRS